MDSDETKSLLASTSLQFENDIIPFPTPLCAQHYHVAYSAIQPRQKFCPTCGISLRHATTRQCPNAGLIIKEHPTNATGFNGTLLHDDKVCLTCYKAHLTILQEEKKKSRDDDLQLIIEEVRQKAYQPTTSQEARDLAINATIAHVGEQLLQQRALLLPEIHDFFTEQQNQLVMANEIEHEGEAVTSQWLLSNLTTALQHHLEYACKAKKYGTILYRPNADLICCYSSHYQSFISMKRRNLQLQKVVHQCKKQVQQMS